MSIIISVLLIFNFPIEIESQIAKKTQMGCFLQVFDACMNYFGIPQTVNAYKECRNFAYWCEDLAEWACFDNYYLQPESPPQSCGD